MDVVLRLSIFYWVYVDKLFKFVSVAKLEPLTVNDDEIVVLYAIKLYEVTSYNQELFIL